MARKRTNTEVQGLLALDCPLRGDIHGDRSVMDFPFFALEKKPQTGIIEHKIGNVSITIRAGEGGIATMYDKEIILYVASIIFELCDGVTPLDTTIREMSEAFGRDEELVRTDVHHFVETLEETGIVERVG